MERPCRQIFFKAIISSSYNATVNSIKVKRMLTTIPASKESRDNTANKAAKKIITFPTVSSRI